jgi:hypothetical protein
VADVQGAVGVGQGSGNGVAADLLHGPELGPRRYRRAAGGRGTTEVPGFFLSSTWLRDHEPIPRPNCRGSYLQPALRG